jgi:DNA-binding winged helix-turn-helix (wHTH) protein
MTDTTRHGYIFDEFRLDPDDRVLFRDEALVMVSQRAVDTLLLLVERRGRVVPKEEILRTVWADAYVEENNLNQAISALRKTLGDRGYIETVPRRGYRFVGAVTGSAPPAARGDTAREPAPGLEVAGGALPLDSRMYVERPADAAFQGAVARRDSIVLVKGARQMGKTSLLARGLQRAREMGVRVALTDLQDLSSSDFATADSLFTALGRELEEALELDTPLRGMWDPEDSANRNFQRYMRREVLRGSVPVVWGLDEVDRLFGHDFSNDVFGLFRSWHNRRALDPSGPWQRLTLVMAYATEAHLFITDVNQSPFNVGTRLALRDFSVAEVEDLNRRYGSPLAADEVERYHALVGGQPYLTQHGLQTVTHGASYAEVEATAARETGPFGDHLRRLLGLLASDACLRDAVRTVLDGTPSMDDATFYRLGAAGILTGDTAQDARIRCTVYADFLGRHVV